MRLLLDTHTFPWFIMGDPRMSPKARQLIEDKGNEKYLSVVSSWEMAIKVGLGKLTLLSGPFDVVVPREIKQGQFKELPITLDHAAIVAKLPHHHRDPFDRMLIAQSLAEGMPVVGNDPAFDAYGITRMW